MAADLLHDDQVVVRHRVHGLRCKSPVNRRVHMLCKLDERGADADLPNDISSERKSSFQRSGFRTCRSEQVLVLSRVAGCQHEDAEDALEARGGAAAEDAHALVARLAAPRDTTQDGHVSRCQRVRNAVSPMGARFDWEATVISEHFYCVLTIGWSWSPVPVPPAPRPAPPQPSN